MAIEITAKSEQEALQKAAQQLGVPEGSVSITVLESTKGLFGRGQVRVRAEAKQEAAAPAKGSSRKPKAEAAAPAETQGVEPEAVAEPEAAAEAPAADPAEQQAPRSGRRPKIGPRASVAAAKPAADKAAPVERSPRKKASVALAAEPMEAIQEAYEDAPAASRPEEEEVQATQQDADEILAVLETLIDQADLDVQAKVTQFSGRYVNIELDGRDAAFLVGKHGEVLNAFQYLVNIIGSRKSGRSIRATLDGNNYRRRREDQLTVYATRIATEVQNRGEEAVLDALPAFERRIVHKALSTFEGVTTYSEGEEPNRRVVIAPAE
jgi:spoIIIJ-associated protein